MLHGWKSKQFNVSITRREEKIFAALAIQNKKRKNCLGFWEHCRRNYLGSIGTLQTWQETVFDFNITLENMKRSCVHIMLISLENCEGSFQGLGNCKNKKKRSVLNNLVAVIILCELKRAVLCRD